MGRAKGKRAKRAEKRDKLEKPGERNELAGACRKRSGNNEEGESELKARKPCVGKRREDGKRSEKIIENAKKGRRKKEERRRQRDTYSRDSAK